MIETTRKLDWYLQTNCTEIWNIQETSEYWQQSNEKNRGTNFKEGEIQKNQKYDAKTRNRTKEINKLVRRKIKKYCTVYEENKMKEIIEGTWSTHKCSNKMSKGKK